MPETYPDIILVVTGKRITALPCQRRTGKRKTVCFFSLYIVFYKNGIVGNEV